MDETVKRYYELDKELKRIKAEHDKLNKAIKDYLRDGGKQTVEIAGVAISYNPQERVSMNEEKLLRKLKQSGVNEGIELVEKVNVEKVESMVYNGVLSPAFLEDCVEKKIVETLTVKGAS